jgi:hypothetical protein
VVLRNWIDEEFKSLNEVVVPVTRLKVFDAPFAAEPVVLKDIAVPEILDPATW